MALCKSSCLSLRQRQPPSFGKFLASTMRALQHLLGSREQHHYRRMRSQPTESTSLNLCIRLKNWIITRRRRAAECVNHFLESWQIILRAAGPDKCYRSPATCQCAYMSAPASLSLAVIIMLISHRERDLVRECETQPSINLITLPSDADDNTFRVEHGRWLSLPTARSSGRNRFPSAALANSSECMRDYTLTHLQPNSSAWQLKSLLNSVKSL